VSHGGPVPRLGGRVFLFDASDRILLIHELLEDGSTHWLTPGGGVENGEHPRDAARREAHEEAGIDVDIAPDAQPVHVTRRLWSWAEVVYDQVDEFFVARVPDGIEPRAARLTDVEQLTLIGMRWWTLPDLAAADAVLLPPDLADRLQAHAQEWLAVADG
jgi:8-oxo-dGTP pyrophosphatase MutT (NUDIX family)